MNDRRSQPRFLNAELVVVSCEKHLTRIEQLGNVADVSKGDVGVIVDYPLSVGSPVTISYREGELIGVVRHYSVRRDGHLIGIGYALGSNTRLCTSTLTC